MNIGDFIKQKRSEQGFTLEQLGKRVGVSKMTVLRWESGEIKNIKSDKIEKLALALDIPVVALFNGFDENGNKIDKPEQLTLTEFSNEVRRLAKNTPDIVGTKEQLLDSTLNIICSDNKN